MNILQRRMFAEGDVVNAGPQPRVDIPRLIEYYVSQGYNALEIKEMLPNLDMRQIESAVSQLGGSVNPAVASPGADEFTGDINVFQEIPETKVIKRLAPKVKLPTTTELDKIFSYIRATKELGTENQILGLKMNFNLTDEEAKEYLSLPDTSVEMTDPSLASLDAVEVIEEPLSATSLAPNEYRTSDGRIFSIDPAKFKQLLSSESPRIISGIVKNPNVEYGSDLKTIIESEALGRSSTLADPESIKVGNKDVYISPDERGELALKFGVDFAKEGIEGLINQARKIVSPEMVGVFKGRDAAKKAREEGRGEYLDIFDTPFSGQGTFAENLQEIQRYGLTGGETPETLDSIILEASVGEVTPDTLSKQLEDLEKTPSPADTVTEDVEAEEEVATTTEKTAEEVVEEKPEGEAVAEDIVATTEETITETKPKVVPAGDFEKAGNVFSSPNFVRFVANLSKGLATSEDMASGLAKGAALAAEERGLRDLEEQKLAQELELERIKSQGTTALKPSELKSLNAMTTEMSDTIKNYEGTQASIGIMNDAISLFEEAQEKGVPITGLPGRLARFKDEASAFIGIDNPNVSDATKIKNYIEQVKQRSIREILNESGRTISNLDRDIVDRVFGDLDLTGDPKEILKKLKNARQSLIINNKDKKRSIASNFEIIQNPAYAGVGTRAISPYFSLIQSILQSDVTGSSKDVDLSSIVDIDLRDKNLFDVL
jgi:hypothetical protein